MGEEAKETTGAAPEPTMTKLEGFDFWRQTLNAAKFVVAPMVDQSELAWRMLSRKYKADLCYTPMLHASVFVRDERYRRENLASCAEDRPLIVQFCANDPEVFLKAAKLAEAHCDAIDLNLGCPQMIAKRGHYGAFLQDEWDLLTRMVSTCHKHLKVPITCKVRVYPDIEKTVQYAQMLEKAGCQLICVHGRWKEMKGPHTGIASWTHIKAVKEAVNIPVYANGNIQYLSDVHRCMKETGVDGVMSAEGNLHNPALFSGLDPPVWEISEEYLDFAAKYPCNLSYIRAHIFKICHHPLSKHIDLREVLAKSKTAEDIRAVVKTIKERCKADVTSYGENPDNLDDHYNMNLPLPYWICQPYVRPSPNATAEEKKARKEQREAIKRPLEISTENGNMSKNKLKKLQRHTSKNFDPKMKVVYEKCTKCGNPKGNKCIFHMCKRCCKKKVEADQAKCPGHRLWPKNKPKEANQNGSTEEEKPTTVAEQAKEDKHDPVIKPELSSEKNDTGTESLNKVSADRMKNLRTDMKSLGVQAVTDCDGEVSGQTLTNDT